MADENYFLQDKAHNPKIQPHVAPIRDMKPAKYKNSLYFEGKLHSDLVFTTKLNEQKDPNITISK